jgi:hypothetical protein
MNINYLDGNSDTIGYSLRYGSNIFKASANINRYLLLLTKDSENLIPVTTASNVTANTKTITTESFDPFGNIFYYNATATTTASNAISNKYIWDRYNLTLTYSFNVANVLTAYKPVYLVAQMQSDGTAKLRNPSTSGLTNSPITQTLPSSDDGFIYIYLGKASSTSALQLDDKHPIYYYKDGGVREYIKGIGNMAFQNTSSYSSATQVNTALAGKSGTGHTHVSSGVTAMTGYAKAASGSSITTSDTLNQAIGKLEAYVDDLNSQSETIAAALNYLNSKGVVSAVTVSSNLNNVVCPSQILGNEMSGAQADVIYVNSGTTTDYTITVSTTYKTPDGNQLNLTCPKNGYCEISYLNINGTIYARGI